MAKTMAVPPQRRWLALAVMLCVFATAQVVADIIDMDPVYCQNPDGSTSLCDIEVSIRFPQSCMSGNTGTFKATPIINSSGFDRVVTIVTALAVGDMIEGLDADKKPALCTVEAIGQFGHGPLFGNYTDDHFVLDPATGGIKQHGAVGNRTVEDKYEVMTSCPVGLDEAGTGFTPMDGDFCGKSTAEMDWSDYLLIHASMLRIVRATGGYWFSASAYSDFDSVVEHGPELCAAMLACAGEGTECDELERVAELFIDHYLTDTARNASHAGMPGLGQVGAPGSASFVVSQGKADTAVSTEGIALIASAAVLVAVVLAAVVVAGVRRRARSTPVTIEVKHIVTALDLVAPGLAVV